MSSIHETWRKNKKVDPFLIAWPSSPIIDDSGNRIDAPCTMDLPKDSSRWDGLIRKVIARTDAYAVLLVEQREKDVRAILESTDGSRCWLFPLARSGDVKRLGLPRVSDNIERLGVLWVEAKA